MESGCCHHSRPDDRGRQPPAGGQYRLRTGIGMPKIIFRLNTGEEQVVEGKDGWSVMQIAMRNDISGIDADCGGSASCATCHVYVDDRSEEHTSELQSLMRSSYAVFCLKKKKHSR